MAQVQHRADDLAEERILDALLRAPKAAGTPAESPVPDNATRQLFRKKLREGELDDKEVDIELEAASIGVEIMAPPGMEEMTSQLQNMFSNLGGQRKTQHAAEDSRGD